MVLTFLHSFEPGGVERVALRLVRAWREAGITAPLFLGREDGAMRAELAQGLSYHAPVQPRIGTRAFETLWMIGTLPAHIRRLRPRLLFCAGNSYAVVAAAMKLILGRDCPPILAKISNDLARRDMNPVGRFFYRLWLRLQGRLFDHVVGMEAPMRAEIAHALAIDPRRISIIPDPALSMAQIETLRACRAAPCGNVAGGSGGRRFVAVGRLAGQKDYPMMLRAFARAAGPADSLSIFGDGDRRREIEMLVASLGLGDRVRLMGHVANIEAHLAEYDVLLLSSAYEGVPAALLEALAAGLAIVATDCSVSMRSLLREGALGHLVAPGDEDGFARAIGSARPGSPDPAASLTQATRFTVESAAPAYLHCFARMLPGAEAQLHSHRPAAAQPAFMARDKEVVNG